MTKIKEILTQGLTSLKTIKQDKQAYKEHLAKIRALPEDYRFVYTKVTEYMWDYSGGGDGYDMIALHTNLLELFQSGATEGKNILDITGEDVAYFCDELLKNCSTYTENRRNKLNVAIHKKIKPTD